MTGNPVRRSVIEGDRARGRKTLGVPEDATLLLVFGGSLGAQHLNERVASLKGELLARENLYILHSTGADGFEKTERALALTPEEAKRYRVQPYIDNMGDMLAAADLVLSRSGASSVAEIAALAVPSVLVPYPARHGRPPDHECALPGRRRCRRAMRRYRYRCPSLCR